MDDPWDRWSEICVADPADVAPEHRHLYAFGWVRGEVNNGGFDQLFSNSSGDVVPWAVEAARAAGLDALAEVIQRAMALLGDPYPTDWEQRWGVLEALPAASGDRLVALDEEFLALEVAADLDEVMRRLAD